MALAALAPSRLGEIVAHADDGGVHELPGIVCPLPDSCGLGGFGAGVDGNTFGNFARSVFLPARCRSAMFLLILLRLALKDFLFVPKLKLDFPRVGKIAPAKRARCPPARVPVRREA